jgi:DNA-directed RNA polymerase specialized sigma24 family protein
MTRAQSADVTAVRERLKAAAKSTIPVTRRAAAQLRDDLATWQRWALDGVTLPRLPRRIRVGLAKPAKKKKDLQKESYEKRAKKFEISTMVMKRALPEKTMLEMLADNYQVCVAIAIAITHSDEAAEDVVSACVASAVSQVRAGKVQADNAAKFHAWLHTIIRRNAMRRAGQSQSRFVEYTERHERNDADFGCTDFDHAREWATGKGLPHAE